MIIFTSVHTFPLLNVKFIARGTCAHFFGVTFGWRQKIGANAASHGLLPMTDMMRTMRTALSRLAVAALLVSIVDALDIAVRSISCDESLPVYVVQESFALNCTRCTYGDAVLLQGQLRYNGVQDLELENSYISYVNGEFDISVDLVHFRTVIDLCNDDVISITATDDSTECPGDGVYDFETTLKLSNYGSNWWASGWHNSGEIHMYADADESSKIGSCEVHYVNQVTSPIPFLRAPSAKFIVILAMLPLAMGVVYAFYWIMVVYKPRKRYKDDYKYDETDKYYFADEMGNMSQSDDDTESSSVQASIGRWKFRVITVKEKDAKKGKADETKSALAVSRKATKSALAVSRKATKSALAVSRKATKSASAVSRKANTATKSAAADTRITIITTSNGTPAVSDNATNGRGAPAVARDMSNNATNGTPAVAQDGASNSGGIASRLRSALKMNKSPSEKSNSTCSTLSDASSTVGANSSSSDEASESSTAPSAGSSSSSSCEGPKYSEINSGSASMVQYMVGNGATAPSNRAVKEKRGLAAGRFLHSVDSDDSSSANPLDFLETNQTPKGPQVQGLISYSFGNRSSFASTPAPSSIHPRSTPILQEEEIIQDKEGGVAAKIRRMRRSFASRAASITKSASVGVQEEKESDSINGSLSPIQWERVKQAEYHRFDVL